MKVFVTGVAGQLGHDVMNELEKRGYEGVGSDIASEYAGVQDGSAVTKMPYISLDITDKAAVEQILCEVQPDVVVHCACRKSWPADRPSNGTAPSAISSTCVPSGSITKRKPDAPNSASARICAMFWTIT